MTQTQKDQTQPIASTQVMSHLRSDGRRKPRLLQHRGVWGSNDAPIAIALRQTFQVRGIKRHQLQAYGLGKRGVDVFIVLAPLTSFVIDPNEAVPLRRSADGDPAHYGSVLPGRIYCAIRAAVWHA